jgi:hypothetical protein
MERKEIDFLEYNNKLISSIEEETKKTPTISLSENKVQDYEYRETVKIDNLQYQNIYNYEYKDKDGNIVNGGIDPSLNYTKKEEEVSLNNRKDEKENIEINLENEKNEKENVEINLENEKDEKENVEINLENEKDEKENVEINLENEKDEKENVNFNLNENIYNYEYKDENSNIVNGEIDPNSDYTKNEEEILLNESIHNYKYKNKFGGAISGLIDPKQETEVNYYNDVSKIENSDLDLIDNTNLKQEIDDKQAEIFLKNLLPIIGTNIFNDTSGMFQGFNSTLTTVFNALTIIAKVRYFTAAELIMALGSNFYTLHFIRGISVKEFNGFFGSVWNGQTNLNFGRLQKDTVHLSDILGEIQNKIAPEKIKNVKDNLELEQAKERTSPKYENLADGGNMYMQPLGSDPMAFGNIRKLNQIKADIFGYEPLKVVDGKWETSKNTKILNSSEIKNKKHSTEPNDYIIDERVENIEYYSLENTDGKWKLNEDPTIISIQEAKERKLDTDREKYFISNDVLNIHLPYSNGGKITKDGIKDERPDFWSVGYILVMPQTEDNNFNNYKIPFEFNPTISGGNISTQYNAQNILSRIGSLQTFSNVDLSTINFSTHYYALSHDENDADDSGNVGNDWMKFFTLKFLQGIQKGYEALSFPHFPANDEQSIEIGFKYTKPPLVKIIIGDANKNENAPYSNLLTYPKDIEDKNEILSSTKNNRLYKTFLVSSMEIEKDLETLPLFLEDKKIKDTFGFSVNMSLVEVSKSYMDVMPNYINYFNDYNTVVSKSLEKIK